MYQQHTTIILWLFVRDYPGEPRVATSAG